MALKCGIECINVRLMVDMLNAVKSVLTDVSSVSPSSEQRGTTVCLAEGMEGRDSLNGTIRSHAKAQEF